MYVRVPFQTESTEDSSTLSPPTITHFVQWIGRVATDHKMRVRLLQWVPKYNGM